MRLLSLVFLSLNLLLVLRSAQAQSAPESFQAGLSAFEKKDWDAARQSFSQALSQEPDNPLLLFNLGLTEYRSGKLGLATALWRRALTVAPGYRPAHEAVRFAQAKLEHPFLPRQFDAEEFFRVHVLHYFTTNVLLLMTALMLLLAGWFTLTYVGAHRRALLDEKPLPPLPWTAGLLSLLFLLTLATLLAKAWDNHVVRATIVAVKIEARSTPETNGTALFELFEGLEVIVRQSSGDWCQVTYPGGQTGWVPRASIYVTNGSVS